MLQGRAVGGPLTWWGAELLPAKPERSSQGGCQTCSHSSAAQPCPSISWGHNLHRLCLNWLRALDHPKRGNRDVGNVKSSLKSSLITQNSVGITQVTMYPSLLPGY